MREPGTQEKRDKDVPCIPRAAFSICAVSAVLVGGLGLTPASAQNSVPTSQSSSVEYRLDVLAEQALTIDELEETASAFVAVGQESSAEIPKDAIEPIVLGAESETKIGIFLPDRKKPLQQRAESSEKSPLNITTHHLLPSCPMRTALCKW